MIPVHGEYCTLSINVSGTYYEILCGKDMTYTRTAEFVEKTGPTSGFAREWAIRLEEWSASVSGLTMIDNGTTVTFFYILQASVRRVAQDIKLHFADEDGNYREITGSALIGTMNINGPATDWSQASIELKGTGDFEMDVIPPPVPPVPSADPVIQEPLYIDCVAGQSSVSDALLTAAGVQILAVERTGTGHEVTLGTPGNLEYSFTAGTGTVDFDATNPFNAGEWIYVLYQK